MMHFLGRSSLLAVAAVTEIALNARVRPFSSKALAARCGLPRRHLERVLQALVREGVLKGTRGRRGGYELARGQREITAQQILRAASAAEDSANPLPRVSTPLTEIVVKAVEQAEQAFSATLAQISIDDLTRSVAQPRNANEHSRSRGTLRS
jgi:Rrf2 family protein